MLSDIKNKVNGLNPNKATTHNNIHPKIRRESTEVIANTLQNTFMNCFKKIVLSLITTETFKVWLSSYLK